MKYKFFSIPVRGAEADQQALNPFRGQHKVVSVERHLVPCGLEAFWAAGKARVDAALDQTIIPSAGPRRRKANAPRQAGRPNAERLPGRRLYRTDGWH